MLPMKESLTVELKSDRTKYPDSAILEAIVALANTEGGKFYLGIENSGEITGAHMEHQDPIPLIAFVANNTVPPVSVRAEIVEDVKPVLKISVPKSYVGIVATSSGKVLRRRIKADGTPENVPMYPGEFSSRLSDLRMLDYSSMQVMQAKMSDFDSVEITRLRKLIHLYAGEKTLVNLTDEELFKALGFVREQDETIFPTVTGLLLIGTVDAIRKYVPTAATSFQVLDGTEVKVNEDWTLPILATIEQINTYIAAWNPEQEMEMGLFRMSVPEFDKRAIREAIVNAFSHRDYTKMGRVRIAINDDGLTIANPGGFIEGVSLNNLLTAEPHGRNPQLADSLKRIGLAERTGRGIDRIFEGSLLYGKALPDYSATTNMTVSLFIARSNVDPQLAKIVSDEQNRLGRPLSLNTLLVLNALKDIPKSNAQTISEAVNLSESVVRNILEKNIETGLVESFGSGRNKTYILSAKVYKTKREKIGYVRHADIDESRYMELILNLAQKSEFISRADVIELLHVSASKAYVLLKTLSDQGKLELVQKGRYAKYRYCGDGCNNV